MNNAEDQDLLLRTYRHSRFACIPEILFAYREEYRTLRKMAKFRYAFFKAVLSDSFANRNIPIIFFSAFMQLFKLLCDAANIQYGIKFLRNPLLPISADQSRQLQEFYKNLCDNKTDCDR